MSERNIVVVGFGDRGGAAIEHLEAQRANCATFMSNVNEPDPFVRRVWRMNARAALQRADMAIFVGGFHQDRAVALSIVRAAKKAGVLTFAIEMAPLCSAGYRSALKKAVGQWFLFDETQLPITDGDPLAQSVEALVSLASGNGRVLGP